MTKLVYSMPEVAHRALSNSMTSLGHPNSKDHLIRYNFMCLQNLEPGNMLDLSCVLCAVCKSVY